MELLCYSWRPLYGSYKRCNWVFYTPWHLTEIIVHFSETLDGSSSWTRRKYPRGYVARNTITPGGHTRWVCGSSVVLERLVRSTLEGFYVKSKIEGEKRLYIYLHCSGSGHCFLRINIPLDLGSFLGLLPFLTVTRFHLSIHPFAQFSSLFSLFHITFFNLCHKGSKAIAPILNGITAGILLSAAVVSGQGNSRLGASPRYQGFNNIYPERCIVTGPNPSNWSTYHHIKQLERCDLPMFYGFNLYDDVDDTDSYNRILACTAYGYDWRENS